ncbi:hypothetical protein CFI00_02615 [Nocardioides sp. S5]|uniref:hypothetical protein n=1 Tax=Nocardioides sp. S5 TaxID=2017486 RepID=UPI001A8E6ECC|nr:hypothetical protein [Nocardioides sp. S5]QSR29411.1 hypothetical protein CFI00_02615 [Nocardioides sp. S5]
MRALVLALVLLVPALAGCSGGEAATPAVSGNVVEEDGAATAEWRADVEEHLGTDVFDFLALQQAAARDCQRADASSWSVELALSGDVSTSALTRIGLEHACADVVEAFDAGLAAVEQTDDPLDLVCGPDVRLSSQDALKADLVCGA